MNIVSSSSADAGVVSPSSPSISQPTGSNSNSANWILSSLSSSPGPGGSKGGGSSELDERVVAKAALDAAEDALESLCAAHAGTFVAVEKRGQRMDQALRDLEATIASVRQKVQVAQDLVWQAQSEEDDYNSQSDGANEQDGIKSNNKKKKLHSLAVLSEKHRVRRRTLLQHSALLELLELPSLMDACVRSNLYEEALSIAGLANSLERRKGSGGDGKSGSEGCSTASSNSNRVISHVVAQIRNRQEDLRRHLLHRLQGPVTMPDCLEVVTALRRLNSIDLELSSQSETDASPPEDYQDRLYRAMEVKLQIDFLEARDVWLDSSSSSNTASTTTTSSSAASSSSEDLLDTIERYRTRVFEIATQFNAIFRANSSSTSSTVNNDMMPSADLLSLWACRRIHAFLQILQQGISNAAANADAIVMTTTSTSTSSGYSSGTTGGSLAKHQQQQTLAFGAANLRDLMEATVFFASSMGRLGADFTAHWIPDIFENALVHWIVQHCWIQQGVKPLHEVWNICQQVIVATPLVAGGSGSSGSGRNSVTAMVVWSNPSADEVEQMFRDFVVPENADALLEQPLAPPRVLMQVPPLGRFVNAILLGLNELRRCLLPSALPRLQQALEEEVLTVVSQELKQFERQLITTTSSSTGVGSHQKDNRRMLREVISLEYTPLWNQLVIPYCRGSLWTAMGRASLAHKEYRSARQAIDALIREKKKDAAALVEKPKRDVAEGHGDNDESENVDEAQTAEGTGADGQEDKAKDRPEVVSEEAGASIGNEETEEEEDKND